jgi:O-antigen ligase
VVVGVVAVGVVIGSASYFESASVFDRLSRWQQVPTVTAEAPFGHGPGSAGAAAGKVDTVSGVATTYTPGRTGDVQLVYQPDNSYLEVLYEDGIPGLALFVVALTLAFAAARRSELEAPPDDPGRGVLAASASALVLAAAVASIASAFFEIFPLDYLFWLLIAVVAVRPASVPGQVVGSRGPVGSVAGLSLIGASTTEPC